MFNYLLRIESKEVLERIMELARVAYQSRRTNVVAVEAQHDIFATLVSTPGVLDVQYDPADGRLMPAGVSD